ncbi:NADH-quinone oxidoreductase subunit B family protein [Commensalibacter oyaizuii]|uniref:NADH-quinone oxidoreductase subunit B n=1 Tax=Commensalibacter oyaizuii TaxID=3043873 RepID=A0ABT6Q0U2_9PROT|nr:NADH-quinone oxidoreductase subunit B [Commensalibacter sp. TBRC 16381]MDI2090610.1 NADH-quinone oxidoreductase subunit B [Commensalibacter sp. TBRC 16381]
MAILRALVDSVFGKIKPLDKTIGSNNQILHLFPVPCGDCNGCILELLALRGGAFDITASGIAFVDHPAIANIMLISGVLTRAMIPYLEKNWALMPEPKAIVTIGFCAIDKGVFEENYAVLKETTGGDDCILQIEGCPPAPQQIMEGLLKLLGLPHPDHQPRQPPSQVQQHQPSVGESCDS